MKEVKQSISKVEDDVQKLTQNQSIDPMIPQLVQELKQDLASLKSLLLSRYNTHNCILLRSLVIRTLGFNAYFIVWITFIAIQVNYFVYTSFLSHFEIYTFVRYNFLQEFIIIPYADTHIP